MDIQDEENARRNKPSTLVIPELAFPNKSPKSPVVRFFENFFDFITPPTSPALSASYFSAYDGDEYRRNSVDSIDLLGLATLTVQVDDEHAAIIGAFSTVEAPATDASLLPSLLDERSNTKSSVAILQRAESKLSIQQSEWRRSLGPLLALASAFVVTFSSVAAKFLLDSFTTPQIGVFRFASLCLVTTPFLFRSRTNPFAPNLLKQFGLLLFLRVCIGSSSFLCRIFAFSRLPLGDATTIMFMSPVFVGIFARIFLREKYRKIFFFSAVLAIAGCTLISRPEFLGFSGTVQQHVSSSDRFVGSVFALASAMSNATIVILLRRLRKVSAQVIIFYFGLGGTVISIVLCWSTSAPIVMPTGLMHWVWIVVLANQTGSHHWNPLLQLASNLGQWLFTMSLRYENANVISLFRASDIIWAFAAQILIFGRTLHWMSACGAILVCFGVVLLAVFKIIESLRADEHPGYASVWRRRLCRCFCCQPRQKENEENF